MPLIFEALAVLVAQARPGISQHHADRIANNMLSSLKREMMWLDIVEATSPEPQAKGSAQ